MAEIKPGHCEQDYWQERWIINDIAFHKERNNPYIQNLKIKSKIVLNL